MRLAAALLCALALAGCTQGGGLDLLARDAPAPEPYYKEHRASVSGEHEREYAFEVQEGASVVNVTLALYARGNGLPLPDAAPARLDLELRDASGRVLQRAALDAQRPVASLAPEGALPAGAYVARVTGVGASQTLEGDAYGAAYALTIEVLYGEAPF